MKDKFLTLSVSAILICLTAVISHGIGLNLVGPTPTAQAGDLIQYKEYVAEMKMKNPDGIYRDFQSFGAWETKKVFKKTLSELEMNQATNRMWKKFSKNKNKDQ